MGVPGKDFHVTDDDRFANLVYLPAIGRPQGNFRADPGGISNSNGDTGF